MRLGVSLDFRARDPTRLWDTLKLSDDQLIAALGGRGRERLRAWHASASASCAGRRPTGRSTEDRPRGVERLCRHLDGYPSTLRQEALAPHELHVAGAAGRLRELLDGPAVAIVGTRRCTDYGLEVARTLGRDLAAVGVCVIVELCEGIAHGAHIGGLQAAGPTVAVAAGGVDRCRALTRVCDRMTRACCVVSELPGGARPRVWSELARARTVALLAQIVIFVEAEQEARELKLAQLAHVLGKPIGAVPGRVTSASSQGTNGLLRDGAGLVRGAGDALDLLYRAGSTWRATHDRAHATPTLHLRPRLRELARAIGEGRDTVAKLTLDGRPDAVLAELAELEIKGVVRRGDGGRYVPCAI